MLVYIYNCKNDNYILLKQNMQWNILSSLKVYSFLKTLHFTVLALADAPMVGSYTFVE